MWGGLPGRAVLSRAGIPQRALSAIASSQTLAAQFVSIVWRSGQVMRDAASEPTVAAIASPRNLELLMATKKELRVLAIVDALIGAFLAPLGKCNRLGLV